MPTPFDIYAKINDYIRGLVTAAELEVFLAPYEQSILHYSDLALARAIRLVGVGLADMDNGQSEKATRAFLRRRLGKLLRTQIGSVIYKEYRYGTSPRRKLARRHPLVTLHLNSRVHLVEQWFITVAQSSVASTEPQVAHV